MIIIEPYAGYGTRSKALVLGRVLEDEGIGPPAAGDRRWRNLAAFLRRMESDELPFARLRIRGKTVVADREGYFRAEVAGRFKAGWNELPVELVGHAGGEAVARVLVPSPAARFGVISDIDDTVVYTHVTRRVRMLLTVALSNARTRKPFAGVAALYQALHRGANPLFYVSKSPWNLYAPLAEMLAHQGLPAGPILLRDFRWRMEKRHKEGAIAAILDAYPRLSFVLVGDSGGCQLVLAPNTEVAAMHAAAEGLIRRERSTKYPYRPDGRRPKRVLTPFQARLSARSEAR